MFADFNQPSLFHPESMLDANAAVAEGIVNSPVEDKKTYQKNNHGIPKSEPGRSRQVDVDSFFYQISPTHPSSTNRWGRENSN